STSGRDVRVVRDGKVVQRETIKSDLEPGKAEDTEYVAGEAREIVVGDRVRLRSFGSIGIVDSLKGDEAEVRLKSLRLREKLQNIELVEAVATTKSTTEKFASLSESSGAEVELKTTKRNGRPELNVTGQTIDE